MPNEEKYHSATGACSPGGKKSGFAGRPAPGARAGGLPHPAASAAFSLIELVVVLVVLAILTAVVIIKSINLNVQSNRIAANELRVNLTYIRNMAANRERTMRVQFSTTSNYYDVYEARTNWTGTYQPVKDPVTQKDWMVDFNSKFSGVGFAVSNLSGNTLYFSETNGIPCSPGGTPLTTNGVITFSSGIRITIAPKTGYVDLE